jgi:hypothetical protein
MSAKTGVARAVGSITLIVYAGTVRIALICQIDACTERIVHHSGPKRLGSDTLAPPHSSDLITPHSEFYDVKMGYARLPRGLVQRPITICHSRASRRLQRSSGR